jgi:hypothetical protein
MSPGTALFQPSCPLTVPRLKVSKVVVTVLSAPATPHTSRTTLAAVARTMSILRMLPPHEMGVAWPVAPDGGAGAVSPAAKDVVFAAEVGCD